MLGPQGTDMIGRDQLLEVARIADQRGLMLHIHVAQGDREIEQMVKRYGQRTPAFLAANNLLNDRLLAVHLTEASDEETDLISSSGARLALCSGSIGIIDGIVPPAHRFRERGGIVGLGSDQASGNNCNNIFNEMKLTALFNKIRFRDPEVMPAWEVLRMATVEGAQAIGLGDRIGSLETGKQADLIIVDVNTPNLLPMIDSPVRTLVPKSGLRRYWERSADHGGCRPHRDARPQRIDTPGTRDSCRGAAPGGARGRAGGTRSAAPGAESAFRHAGGTALTANPL